MRRIIAPRELFRVPLKACYERPSSTVCVCRNDYDTLYWATHLQIKHFRGLHSSSHLKFKERYFPAPEAPSIRTTEAAWPHPM